MVLGWIGQRRSGGKRTGVNGGPPGAEAQVALVDLPFRARRGTERGHATPTMFDDRAVITIGHIYRFRQMLDVAARCFRPRGP